MPRTSQHCPFFWQTSAEIEYAGQLHTLGKDALHTAGFCRVGYLPGYGASKVFCIWECKDELPRETFDDIRKALDPGPLGDVQVIYQVDTELPGASVPASAFKKDAWTTPKPPGPFAPSTGSFFWVRAGTEPTSASDSARGFSVAHTPTVPHKLSPFRTSAPGAPLLSAGRRRVLLGCDGSGAGRLRIPVS